MIPLPEAMCIFGSGLFIGSAMTLILCMEKIERYRMDSERQRITASVSHRRLATAEAAVERLTEQANELLEMHEPKLRSLLK